MTPSRLPTGEESGLPRRTFLQAGMAALALGGAGTLTGPDRARAEAQAEESRVEWRNKQAGMSYRRLGRTGREPGAPVVSVALRP